MNLNFLIKKLLQFKARNPGLELNSNLVRTPIDKHGRTPIDYIPCVVEAFKGIKKRSSYNRRILLKYKPPGKIKVPTKNGKISLTYLKQGYVNRFTEMLNKTARFLMKIVMSRTD